MPLFRRRREQAFEPPAPLCVFLVSSVEDPADALEQLDVPASVEADVHPAEEGIALPAELWEAAGLAPELRERAAAARFQIVLVLSDPGEEVGAAVLALAALADRAAELTGGVVTDFAAQRMYAPGAWRIDEPIGELDVREHVIVHFVTDGQADAWVHTHGLAKFGRPELEVFDLESGSIEAVGRVLLEVGQYTMDGALIAPGQTMDLAGLRLVAKAGEREPEHWGDFAVLELAPVPNQG